MRCPLLLLATCAVSLCSAQDFGPIETRNHRALSLPFLRIQPRPNELLKPNQEEVSVGWTEANDFRLLGAFEVVEEDTEITRLLLVYRQGLASGDEWGVEVPLMLRGGGFLDPIIDWWHENILHWSDNLRDSTPFGRSTVLVPGSDPFDSASGLGDVAFTYAKRIDDQTLAIVAIKLPTGQASELLGSGGIDAGLSLQRRMPLAEKWALYVQLGGIMQSDATELEGTRDLIDQEALALVYQANSKDAWVAQWQSEASAIETGISGSDAAHRLITIGYKRKISSDEMLEMFFCEDRDLFNGNFPEGANVGPDFTAGIRWIRKY